MQTKWIEPSKLYATGLAKAEERKAVNSARVISPDAIANSRWRTGAVSRGLACRRLGLRTEWPCLAAVLDLFTRKIVGWAMRDRMRAELTIAALTGKSRLPA
jgi:transposase InsO family protein